MNDEIQTQDGGPPPQQPRLSRRLVFLICFLSLLLVSVFVTLYLGSKIAKAPVEIVETIQEIIKPEINVTNFTQWAKPSNTQAGGNRLEVVTTEATEVHSTESSVSLRGVRIPGTTTTHEIRVPAIYRYYIDLSEKWEIETDPDKKRVVVIAPKLQPTLPVAFDSAKVEKKTEKGWLIWTNKETELKGLEGAITKQLGEHATSAGMLDEVRESARLGVVRFVEKWLIGLHAWGKDPGEFEEILVYFEDEDPSAGGIIPVYQFSPKQTNQVAP